MVRKCLNSIHFLEREEAAIYTRKIIHRDLKETCDKNGSSFKILFQANADESH